MCGWRAARSMLETRRGCSDGACKVVWGRVERWGPSGDNDKEGLLAREDPRNEGSRESSVQRDVYEMEANVPE